LSQIARLPAVLEDAWCLAANLDKIIEKPLRFLSGEAGNAVGVTSDEQ